MFTTNMKHRINCHIKSTKVVTVKDQRKCKCNVKIFYNKYHPCERLAECKDIFIINIIEFGCNVGYDFILCFSARPRDDMLFFYTLRNKDFL